MTTSKCRPVQILKSNSSILALASCTLAMSLLMTLFNFYYVKVFLEIYHISSPWLNAAQMTYMICNFATGPIIAYGLDYGFKFLRNRRRLVLFSGPAIAMIFMIPWFPWYPVKDADDPDNWAPGVHLTIVLILWNISYSIVGSCSCGLFAEISIDHEKRVKALTCNQIAMLIGATVVFPVDSLSKSVADFRTFQIFCGIVAAIAIALFIFTGLKASDVVAQTGCGRVQVNQRNGDQEGTKFPSTSPNYSSIVASSLANLKAYFIIVIQVLRTRNFWCPVIANSMTFFRAIIINNFFAVYTEGLVSSDILPTGSVVIATFYLISQVAPRVIFVLSSPIIRRFGSYKILKMSLILTWLNSAAGLYLDVFVGYNSMIAFLLLESILVNFQNVFVIIYSEVIDQDTKTHNRTIPATTIIFTLTGLFIQPSASLAPMIVVAALNIGYYDQYQEHIRSAPAYTQWVMFLVATCIPAFASIVSFCSLCFYKREKSAPRTTEDAITQL